MFCKNCGNQIDDNAYVCMHCGVRVSDEVPLIKQEHPKYCTHCGQQIDPNAYICVHCGVIVHGQGVNTKVKRPSNVFAIISIVMTFLTATLFSAIFAIIGMIKAINSKDKKGIKLSLVAICLCVVVSIGTIYRNLWL